MSSIPKTAWLAGIGLGLAAFAATGEDAAAPAPAALYAAAHTLQLKPALVMAGTVDEEGFPQIRVVSNLRRPSHPAAKLSTGDHDFVAYAVTRADSEKLKQLAENPRMSMYYQDGGQGLLLMGRGEVVADADTRRAVWEEDFRQLGYGGGADDPMLVVLRFTPERGKFYYQGRQNKLTFPPPAR